MQPLHLVQQHKIKPVLKWAGGKTQLLNKILPLFPEKYNKYIEPFFGGGAVFFGLCPEKAVISDLNAELVNLYNVISNDVEALIRSLCRHKNDKEYFYKIREKSLHELTSIQSASRTIFLNRTCYNGLFRVNKSGNFNVPFGNYKNPNICYKENLRAVAKLLYGQKILCGDYKYVLNKYAKEGDLVFLDPPYLPISEYSDFKRYTKEQFYEEDHRELAEEVKRLSDIGCSVILTNSNHPLVHDLYGKYQVEVFNSRRSINSKANGRRGEDVVIKIEPRRKIYIKAVPDILCPQTEKYPPTRYMGSKSKLLPQIRDVINQFDCETVLDLFSGSGVVGYMLKAEGKQVTTNDYMALSEAYAKAMIENNHIIIPESKAFDLLCSNSKGDHFIERTFDGLYFTKQENQLIDNIRANIKKLRSPYERAIATTGIIRACFKKRPRGIFTYVGHRYDDGRKDLKTGLDEHFITAINSINKAVFNNGKKNKSRRGDAMTIRSKPDLVYMDPPYYTPYSDNEYVRRYHFVEGIARNWEGVEMQWHTKTKKFKSYPTPFSTRNGAHNAFDCLFRRFRDSIIVVSYSSNSLPTLDEMVALIAKYKTHVDVISIDYKYSLGNQGDRVSDNNNNVKEYIFVGQ